MTTLPHKLVGFAIAVLALFCLTGCSTMRPLATQPPTSRLLVPTPFSTLVSLRTAAFPAGEYRPMYEDDGGYYYQAPGKIVEHGILLTHLCEGGLYVKRGSEEPTKWYLIEENGAIFFGRFKLTRQEPPPLIQSPPIQK